MRTFDHPKEEQVYKWIEQDVKAKLPHTDIPLLTQLFSDSASAAIMEIDPTHIRFKTKYMTMVWGNHGNFYEFVAVWMDAEENLHIVPYTIFK